MFYDGIHLHNFNKRELEQKRHEQMNIQYDTKPKLMTGKSEKNLVLWLLFLTEYFSRMK